MQDQDPAEADTHVWGPRILWVPWFVRCANRDGVQMKLLWPGFYSARRSRSMNCWIYRRARP